MMPTRGPVAARATRFTRADGAPARQLDRPAGPCDLRESARLDRPAGILDAGDGAAERDPDETGVGHEAPGRELERGLDQADEPRLQRVPLAPSARSASAPAREDRSRRRGTAGATRQPPR